MKLFQITKKKVVYFHLFKFKFLFLNKVIYKGLPNLLNTCYMNSILQILAHSSIGQLVISFQNINIPIYSELDSILFKCIQNRMGIEVYDRYKLDGYISFKVFSLFREITSKLLNNMPNVTDNLEQLLELFSFNNHLKKNEQQDSLEFFNFFCEKIYNFQKNFNLYFENNNPHILLLSN